MEINNNPFEYQVQQDNEPIHAIGLEYSCVSYPWSYGRKYIKGRWIPAESKYLMAMRCSSSPWALDSLSLKLSCSSVRAREVSLDCLEIMVKRANLERVSQAWPWVWCDIDCSPHIHYSPETYDSFRSPSLGIEREEILFEYQDQCSLNTLSAESAGHYREVLPYCTLPSSYMLCAASLNLADLIVSESAFISEI